MTTTTTAGKDGRGGGLIQYDTRELLRDLYVVIDAQNLKRREKDKWKKKFKIAARRGQLHLPNLPPDWLWRLCSASLMRGEFRWIGYEFRSLWAAQLANHPWKYPRWDGTAKNVLVLAEQGLGDEVSFISCLPDLIATGSDIVYQADDRLIPALERTYPTVKFITRYQGFDNWDERRPTRLDSDLDFPPRAYESFIPAGSLFTAFRQGGGFPRTPFLKSDEGLREFWGSRLPENPIGIAWAGRAGEHQPDLLLESGFNAVSCQYTNPKHNWAPLAKANALDIGLDWHRNIDGALAALDCLHHVNSVCNTLVHLAGALGVTTNVIKQEPVFGEGRENSYENANNLLRWAYGSGKKMPVYGSVRVYQNAKEWESE